MNKSVKTLTLFAIRGVKTASTKPTSKDCKGMVVKRINSENKGLFGKLLETQKERREKILKYDDSLTTSGESAENNWQSSINSGRVLKLRTKDDDDESLVKAALDNSVQRKQFVPSLGPTTKKIKNYFRSSNNENVENIGPKQKLNSATVASTANKAAKLQKKVEPKKEHIVDKGLSFDIKVPVPLLPDSVIRNITSFPMLNLEKSKLKNEPTDLNKDLVWKYPSVSKVLNATMSDSSRAALARWRSKLTEQLGEEGFNEYYRDILPQSSSRYVPFFPHNVKPVPNLMHYNAFHTCVSSQEVYTKYLKAQLNRGSQFHSTMQNYLSGQPLPKDLDPEVEACWSSLSYILGSVSDVAALERPVVHSQLLYKGVIDCVANFNGEPVVVEWKKSAKQKPQLYNTYDAPIQLAAYLGAMNFDPTYDIKVSGGLVAVAYSDGTPAQVFHLSFEDFTPHWQAWLTRLQKFWIQQSQALKENKLKKL